MSSGGLLKLGDFGVSKVRRVGTKRGKGGWYRWYKVRGKARQAPRLWTTALGKPIKREGASSAGGRGRGLAYRQVQGLGAVYLFVYARGAGVQAGIQAGVQGQGQG